MSDKLGRGLVAAALFITFISAGLGMLTEPSLGVIAQIQKAGINYQIVAYAFIVSGVMNGIDGYRNKPLNPLWFAVFIFYTGMTWVAVQDNPLIPFAPAAFYSLLCILYTANYWAEERGEKLKNDLTRGN